MASLKGCRGGRERNAMGEENKGGNGDLIVMTNSAVAINIGVGRFRILGGPMFRILDWPRGDQIPSRHMTS